MSQSPGNREATTPARQIIPAPPKGLALRSAALVRRGLRDLARQSNWVVKKVFEGPVTNASVSPSGDLCTFSSHVRHGTQRVALFDVERNTATMTLSVPGESPQSAADLASIFAWSPDGRHLVAAWDGWPRALQLFDLHAKRHLGAFGEFSEVPSAISWAADTATVAVAVRTPSPELQLWRLLLEGTTLAQTSSGLPSAPLRRMGKPDWVERQTLDAESAEAGTFFAYGKTAIRPGRATIATVMEIKGDWADDQILLLDAESFERRGVFAAQGQVTDLAWAQDGGQLVYCSAGQAYSIAKASSGATSLPFGAERCAWHPNLPICLFFSSWLRNSAKGRLFLADMNRVAVFDEYPAEGILDLRWSADGSKAYAVNNEGLVFVYEPELL